MRVRATIVGVSALALGGFVLYDYYGPDATRARALHDVQALAPDVRSPPCLPPGDEARPFAVALKLDARPAASLDSDIKIKGALKFDCIRGGPIHETLGKVVQASGEGAVPFFAAVLARCPQLTEYPAPACMAMDALALIGTPPALAELQKLAADKATPRELRLGAIFRLAKLRPGTGAASFLADPERDVRAIALEQLRTRRDGALRASFTQAYEQEKDEALKGKLKAAVLELDNPGKCVAEDEGAGADGVCRYYCDENLRLRYAKTDPTCALVHEREAGPTTSAASLMGK